MKAEQTRISLHEFKSENILVESCCYLFGMSIEEARRRAAIHQLPIAAFHLGSQKSPWLVSPETLALHIDKRKMAAGYSWCQQNAT